ncbi:MAG: ATP-binding cassette, subfamily bacterial IrtB/YbtQ [Mycobacterium sp.]|jgi:energy-coupling factor transporter ATP-binding protein EcfA2|nr:ATP-binding cassette, subfamily bacterial IrtB/YbtQ [Mycobacterium sp.]
MPESCCSTEATSALDPENEHHVAESIRALAQQSAVIVIAHKLSTVTAADNIVVLSDDGTVEDSGTHADLMAADGQYGEFWAQRVSNGRSPARSGPRSSSTATASANGGRRRRATLVDG